MKPIPAEFIKKYVEQLLDFAKKCSPESMMQTSAILRAEHVMDLVKSWKEKCESGND